MIFETVGYRTLYPFFMFGASFLAGWLVNWAVVALPERHSWRITWRLPWQALFGDVALAVNGVDKIDVPRWRTRAVWLAALVLGWITYLRLGPGIEGMLIAVYIWFFLAVAVIDLEHRRVLNVMLLAAFPVMLGASLMVRTPNATSALLGAAIGFGSFLLLTVVRPGAMGMGDVKLAGIIGLCTGLGGVFIALFVGIMAGGVAAIVVLIRNRLNGKATMAYAPYLVIGAWTALLFGGELWQWYVNQILTMTL